MMELFERLIDALDNKKVKEVRIGLHTTAVVSVDGRGKTSCGLASTLRSKNCDKIADAGNFYGKDIKEISNLILNGTGAEKSVAVAAINSALPLNNIKYVEINAFYIIADKGRNGRVGVIGHFPFVDDLRKVCGKVYVSELEPRDEKDITPEEMDKIIPELDALAVSALTLINGSFEGIIKRCSDKCFKILLGPSAPLSNIMLDYVNVVSGSIVENINTALKDISEGTSFKKLRGKKLVSIARDV
jgi:uncharacterized protein (DUF4213/DUF364 family)